MTYDPTEQSQLDIVRGLAGDTSNDVATEILADETYLSILARHTNWKHGAAEVLRRVAAVIEAKPTSISAPSDGSIGWSSRTQTLRDLAKRLDAEADQEDATAGSVLFGPLTTFRSRFLTGCPDGGEDAW